MKDNITTILDDIQKRADADAGHLCPCWTCSLRQDDVPLLIAALRVAVGFIGRMQGSSMHVPADIAASRIEAALRGDTQG